MIEHHNPEEAHEGEIVGRPTLLARFDGRLDAQQILDSFQRIGYPLEDVSVLFKVMGSDEVVDLIVGHVAAGQSISEEKLKSKDLEKGQTVVLLHPTDEQFPAVKQVLLEVGNAEIEYSGETHAFGRPGGVERHDEQVT